MSTILDFSTAFYSQTDSQFERTIQTLEDMLRMCMMDLGGSWDDHLPLVEFAYNNSYHSNIQIVPYEALYGRKYRSPLCWNKVGERELTGLKIIHDVSDKVTLIRKRLETVASRQKSYADLKCKDVEFQVGDYVFLKVSPMKGVMRFGKNRKLASRYIGLFKNSRES